MIYSCTMFFNEIDLLKLKIDEELSEIDQMIIVEANKTHSNKNKNLILRNIKICKNPKIKVIEIIDKFSNDSIFNENLQRDSAILGLSLKNDDVIICTDLDEINTKEDINFICENAKKHGLVKLMQKHYYYKINLTTNPNCYWKVAFATTGKFLKENNLTLSDIRFKRKGVKGVNLKTNGRHFGYLGDPEKIAEKLKSFCHTNYDKPCFTDLKEISKRIKNKEDILSRKDCKGNLIRLQIVKIDETYPKSILNNIEFWQKYIEKHD